MHHKGLNNVPHHLGNVYLLYDASMSWTNRATVYGAKNPVPRQD